MARISWPPVLGGLIELRRSAMGMVFQHFGLMPHLNVLDNVAFPLRVQGRSAKDRYMPGRRK